MRGCNTKKCYGSLGLVCCKCCDWDSGTGEEKEDKGGRCPCGRGVGDRGRGEAISRCCIVGGIFRAGLPCWSDGKHNNSNGTKQWVVASSMQSEPSFHYHLSLRVLFGPPEGKVLYIALCMCRYACMYDVAGFINLRFE